MITESSTMYVIPLILVLIVDDDPMNLEIIIKYLVGYYQLECCETGEACLEKLQTMKLEVILLDINMPGIGGLETSKKIKENPEISDIPVLFVTTLVHSEAVEQGCKALGGDYIFKPFEEDELLVKIELALPNLHQQHKSFV